jgi:hypothetical protein
MAVNLCTRDEMKAIRSSGDNSEQIANQSPRQQRPISLSLSLSLSDGSFLNKFIGSLYDLSRHEFCK